MLVIRFRRVGKKNKPVYRVVVAEHTFPLDGRFTADLGSYNPHSKTLILKKDEAIQWLNQGAKPSNSVAKLLKREKINHNSVVIIKKKRAPKKAEEKGEKPAVTATDETETPVKETATEVTKTPTEETAEVSTESAEPATEETG